MTMFSIFVVLFSLPSIVFSLPFFTKLQLPPPAIAPESVAFAFSGEGPYTGVADGRIMKYQGPNIGFQDYAFNSPNRSKRVCDGNTNPALGPLCGRPLGLGFYSRTGELFVCDTFLGFFVVGTNGGLARQLATSAEGVPFRFLNALAVDQRTGIVYLTDASARFTLTEIQQAIDSNDATGRLLKYDPKTKNISVLLRGLSVASGVEVSSDSTHVLISEYVARRVRKYWLEGPKANTSEILINLSGRPDNIKRTASGDFLVAVTVQSSPAQTIVPIALKINSFGKILGNVSLREQYKNTSISQVQEFGGAIYVGSVDTDFVGKYQLNV